MRLNSLGKSLLPIFIVKCFECIHSGVIPKADRKPLTSKSSLAFDSDEGELLSGWEDDSPTEDGQNKSRYLLSFTNPVIDSTATILLFSTVKESDVEDDTVYMDDMVTR
jgi:hypothetical protein